MTILLDCHHLDPARVLAPMKVGQRPASVLEPPVPRRRQLKGPCRWPSPRRRSRRRRCPTCRDRLDERQPGGELRRAVAVEAPSPDTAGWRRGSRRSGSWRRRCRASPVPVRFAVSAGVNQRAVLQLPVDGCTSRATVPSVQPEPVYVGTLFARASESLEKTMISGLPSPSTSPERPARTSVVNAVRRRPLVRCRAPAIRCVVGVDARSQPPRWR